MKQIPSDFPAIPMTTTNRQADDNAIEQIRKMMAKVAELASSTKEITAPDLGLALEKVTQALKALSDIEKSHVEIRKVTTDEQKARYDLEHAAKQERAERRQRYVSLLTPLATTVATTVVLALTLLSQTYQFVKSEQGKREASEDAQWSAAVKTISESAKLSPIVASLNPFLKSNRYAAVARQTAVQALASTHDPIIFAELFTSAFVPVDWANFDTVLQLDRGLGPRLGEFYEKSYVKETKQNDWTRLTPEESEEYHYIRNAIQDISLAVGPLLKEPRPAGRDLDLRSTWFSYCDWSGVNLYGANLDNLDIRSSNLKGADLGGVTSFQGIYVYRTAWWEAKRISPELLQHLLLYWPLESTNTYGPQESKVSVQEYEESVARLKAAK